LFDPPLSGSRRTIGGVERVVRRDGRRRPKPPNPHKIRQIERVRDATLATVSGDGNGHGFGEFKTDGSVIDQFCGKVRRYTRRAVTGRDLMARR